MFDKPLGIKYELNNNSFTDYFSTATKVVKYLRYMTEEWLIFAV